MSLLTIFSILLFLLSFCALFQVFRGSRKMQSLSAVQPEGSPETPLVSIIVPACNEEATVEVALRSLLQQDYPNLEVIVMDDRSTDGTYGLLNRLAQEFPEARVEQITELPSGWLGKNHALHWGARGARGEILLFTDADIVMAPDTLSRAVAYFVEERLDHLSLIFRNVAQGGLLNAMVVDALGGLFLLLRPWKVREAGSSAFIGVGAFNMIRREAYWKLGGHAALKMHPIDDIMLGKKVKQQGMSQGCLLGGDYVQVRWYGTVAEMVRGLQKNIFALYSYRVAYAAIGVCGIVLMTIVPFWGLILAQGAARIFFGLAVVCRFALFLCNARAMKVSSLFLPWSLITPFYIGYIVIRAVWVTLAAQGIEWRGTHYPLEQLKKEEPLFTFLP